MRASMCMHARACRVHKCGYVCVCVWGGGGGEGLANRRDNKPALSQHSHSRDDKLTQ